METVSVAIIGSGPAGYTAGLYAARAKLEPALFAGYQSGGQLMWTSEVENFPGFPEGVRGPELMQRMREQAAKFGTKIIDEFVSAVDLSQRPFKIWTTLPSGTLPAAFEQGAPAEISEMQARIMKENQPALAADAVIVATGAVSIMLGIPGEQEFFGRGVSTCAVCDAAFYKDKVAFVVGGGDSAMEDTLALTKFARSVTVVHRRDQFRASKIMQERVLQHPKVQVLWNAEVQEVLGDQSVKSVKIKVDGNVQEYAADGLFLAIGHTPMTKLFADQLQLDAHGYLVTRQSMTQLGLNAGQAALSPEGLVRFPTMTSVEGVFAAGDGVDVRYKQAVTAAGMGCAAALDAERWLESRETRE